MDDFIDNITKEIHRLYTMVKDRGMSPLLVAAGSSKPHAEMVNPSITAQAVQRLISDAVRKSDDEPTEVCRASPRLASSRLAAERPAFVFLVRRTFTQFSASLRRRRAEMDA